MLTSFPGSRYQSESGLTLVELLVVLAVIGLISGLAVPAIFGSLPGHQLRTLAEQITSEARYARIKALNTGQPVGFRLDVDRRIYSAGDRKQKSIPEFVKVTFVFARQLMESEHAGEIRFFPDGTSTGGVIDLDSHGRLRKIHVDWFDGSVINEAAKNE